jgi:hypothetical protein
VKRHSEWITTPTPISDDSRAELDRLLADVLARDREQIESMRQSAIESLHGLDQVLQDDEGPPVPNHAPGTEMMFPNLRGHYRP